MKIGILGSGAYAIALASCLIEKNEVVMWTKFESERNEILNTRYNSKALNGVKIDENINVTCNLSEVCNSDFVVVCIPSEFVRATVMDAKEYLTNKKILIASKGIETKTGLVLSEVVKNVVTSTNVSVISGGTFAIDLVNHKKCGLTLAGEDNDIIREAFTLPYLELEETTDINGVQVLGSIKNVYAILFGMLDGINANNTTVSYYFKKMIDEIKVLLVSIGANENTIYSFSGISDIYLTCSSSKSRNFSFGKMIATDHENYQEYLSSHTVEGASTINAIMKIMNEKQIKLPLIEKIYNIIYNNSDIKDLN